MSSSTSIDDAAFAGLERTLRHADFNARTCTSGRDGLEALGTNLSHPYNACMRLRWLRLIALLFVVGGMACQVDVVAMISESDLKVEQNEVPGTYVFNQRETRDELVLRDDGTFRRSAVYGGIRQAQAGTWRLWNMREETASRIEFDATTPKCLKSTRRPDALLVWREPNDFICGGHVPYFCREWGRPGICFGGDAPAYFRKQQ
jgi:hypothetical protein